MINVIFFNFDGTEQEYISKIPDNLFRV